MYSVYHDRDVLQIKIIGPFKSATDMVMFQAGVQWVNDSSLTHLYNAKSKEKAVTLFQDQYPYQPVTDETSDQKGVYYFIDLTTL